MFAIFVVMSYKFLLNFLMPAFCLSSLALGPVSSAQECRTWMPGAVFSPKEVGVSVTLLKPDKTSLYFGIAADTSDVLIGSPVTTGVRLCFNYDLPVFSSVWNDIPFSIYAGPGLVCGYLHDAGRTDMGVMAGTGCNSGIRFDMWHDTCLTLEWKLDLAFILTDNTNLEVYRTGLKYFYIPCLIIQHAF